MSEKVRVGVIGVGNMGGAHLENYAEGRLPEIEMTAVADIDPTRFERAQKIVPGIACFDTAEELFASGLCDAVIIATPHYAHPPLAIEALKAGLHVMSEKPAGVYTKQVREAMDFAATTDKTYAIMFNQRTNCLYRKLKELLDSGKYGEIKRVSWIITDWFRGVMLNQCPHQLDLWQWLCGMPSKVRAFCHEGKWHDIEVEDDVTIYVEYPNGATGTFITTTGDCPGANRLEITCDRAKFVIDCIGPNIKEHELWMYELEESTQAVINTAEQGFGRVPGEWKKIETDGRNDQHVGVMNAFAAHILRGEPLVAEGREGINGLTISNAAFLSSWLGKEITLPMDEDLYWELLQKKIAGSKAKTKVSVKVETDMKSTY